MIRAKGGREATSLEDLANILRNDGGLKGGTLVVALGKEQWSDLSFIVKVEWIEFADGLDGE